MSANFRTITKFSIIGFWAVRNLGPPLVRVFTHDISSWGVVADEAMLVTASAASNIRASHSCALSPHKLSIVSALRDLAVLVAHWIAGLSGEIVALTLVVPKLNGPHKSLYGSRISVPEEYILSDGILFQVPEGVWFVP